MWRKLPGDEWAAFDELPAPVRQRLREHAYDAWSVNALALWRGLKRRYASSPRALITLVRYLEECERLEREAFSAAHLSAHGSPLPHVAARVSVQRYAPEKIAASPCGLQLQV